MCLYLKDEEQTEPSVANKPITVYKVIRSNNKPYFFSDGETYMPNAECIATNNNSFRTHDSLEKRGVAIEVGIHAFTTLRGAQGFLDCEDRPNHSKIVAMTIPEGARYYLGTYTWRDADRLNPWGDEIVCDRILTGDLQPLEWKRIP